jgi:hypothetical protein
VRQAYRLPLPLLAACAACEGGVNRTHLVDATTDGALLLELYSRDGIGAMISADFYEARHAPVRQLDRSAHCRRASCCTYALSNASTPNIPTRISTCNNLCVSTWRSAG